MCINSPHRLRSGGGVFPTLHPASCPSIRASPGAAGWLPISAEDLGRLEAAYHFAADAHARADPARERRALHLHPVAVAKILAGWHLDCPALCAALLHDVMEDTHISKARSRQAFRQVRAELVDRISKLDKDRVPVHEEAQAKTSARCCWRWPATCG